MLSRWLFNNLKYHVNKDIKATLYKNPDFLKSRWGLMEYNVVQWSTHYVKYALLTLLMFFLFMLNLKIWQADLLTFAQPYLPHWKMLLNWQGLFLAGQLTIIGVIYPLVVGLVSVLFQNKSAKKILFPVYQKYSGFMFAGLSGLVLSIFIVVGSLLRVSMYDSTYFAFAVISAFWLIFNLLLTSWFFVQTFNILNDGFRNRLLVRYSIHEACEYDIRQRIQYLLMGSPSRHGLLHKPEESILKLDDYHYSNENVEEVIMYVDKNFDVVDVRYRILNLAIRIQAAILKIKKVPSSQVSLKPMRKNVKGKAMIVATYEGFNLNPFVKFLIRSAYKFGRSQDSNDEGFSTVLSALVGPIDDSLRDSDTREYSNSVANLVDWHTEIAQALTFINDNGDVDNWLLLPSRGMFGHNYLGELLREYYRLGRQAVEKISDNSSYYEDLLYLHKKIYVSREQLVDKEQHSLIQGNYYLWYLLIEWRSYTGDSSNLRINDKYVDVLYSFVGAWESWLNYIMPKSERSEKLEQTYPAYLNHLEFTALTAISALRFDNYEAAGWGVDMLTSWFSNFSDNDINHSQYRWRSNLVNHKLLSLGVDHRSWKQVLREQEFNEKDAFDLAFKNAHVDIRVITACYMLIKPNSTNKELLAKYVKALLVGNRIHPTGAIGTPSLKVTNAGELLGLYIRHRDYRNSGDSYGGWLSSVLESFGRLHDQKRVSGRIYSGWGSMSPSSMGKAYVEIALSMSGGIWSLPADWKESLLSTVYRNEDRRSIISDMKEWIRISGEELGYTLFTKDESPILVENFNASVSKIIELLKKKEDEDIQNAEIDMARLRSFSLACSEHLTKKEYSYPLNQFDEVDLNPDVPVNGEFEVGIANYKKEKIAEGVDLQRSINEGEWMSTCISEDIEIQILKEVLSYPVTSQYEYQNESTILQAILDMSENLESPELICGDEGLIMILHRALYEQSYIDNFNISRKDGFGSRYICHIGRCEVYSLRFSNVEFSLLTSKDIFSEVKFKSIDEQQYVEVDFELNEGSKVEGRLALSYKMDVILKGGISCIKLSLLSD